MKSLHCKAWLWSGAFLLVLVAALAVGSGRDAGPRYAGRSLRYWLGELTSEDYQARLRAETALAGMGNEALPELIRVTGARDSAVGSAWRRGWQTLFPASRAQPSPEMLAMAAARLLSRFGAEAGPAATALVRMLVDGSPDVAREVEPVLRRIGSPAVAPLAAVLARGVPPAQDRVLQLLASSGGTDFGAAATNLLTEVLRFGDASDASVRLHSVAAIAGLRADPVRAVPFLIARLEDADVTVRCAAAAALGKIGPAATSATDLLVAMVNTGSGAERLEAASALWEISDDTTLAIPALQALLDTDEYRSSAAVVLARMGRRAAAAVPTMLSALARERTHRPSRTPSMVAVALGKAGPSAVPGLVELLSHCEADVRINAAFALRSQGSEASPAVSALQAMLRADDAEERMTAASTLAAVGPAAREAESELSRLAGQTSGDVIVGHVASAARDALRRIRPPAPDGLPTLP